MESAAIRRKFLDYFSAAPRSHREVPSASLVPADDPTVLFTNAGMVQFKRVFQGLERRDYSRAVTCQKCVRAGGKHNDLEQVGHTARHHTFFEMLGNFSFGDYFKREAVGYAWEWVTSDAWLGISPDRIYITVHHTDDEARTLWREVAGVPDERIFGLGDEDNFWQMGETGPAGPCSEILVDVRAKRHAGRGKRKLGRDEFVRLSEAGALLEIWNLVFMQYDLRADGSRSPLPAASVDTGAGLERVAAVMQGVASNFDTDLFTPVIRRAVEVVGKPYDRGPGGASYRVLADHARAVAFLLADGVFPSNEGRGYVLRRILRRAVRHAWLLGRRAPTLVHLAHEVCELMGVAYPELLAKRQHIETVTRAEEERFFETIEGGLKRLDELKRVKVIPGADAFKLYDTYGFPIDLTQLIAAERRQTVDVAGFERELGKERTRSQEALERSKGGPAVQRQRAGEWRVVKPKASQQWVGYDTTRADPDLLAFRQAGDTLELVLEENPFYAESGGQVSDTGRVQGEGWELQVADVEKVEGGSAVDVPGASLELGGGTHVPTAGQIGLSRFTHEAGGAAGVGRIEAETGPGAYELIRKLEAQLEAAAGALKSQPEHLVRRIETLLEENRKLERRVEELLKGGTGKGEGGRVEKIGDVELHLEESAIDDRNQIAILMDAFRAQHKRAISMLFTNGERPGIHVAVTDDLVSEGVKAGGIAGAIAGAAGGKGGGRAHFASAGAGDPAKLSLARAQASAIVRRLLGR